VAKIHILLGQFPQKSQYIISDSFAKRNLQLKASYASSPPCIKLSRKTITATTKSHSCNKKSQLQQKITAATKNHSCNKKSKLQQKVKAATKNHSCNKNQSCNKKKPRSVLGSVFVCAVNTWF